MQSVEPQSVVAFKAWLVENGAHIHPDVLFEPVPSGFNVIAAKHVPQDSTIVTIPFSLAITPELSKAALQSLLRIHEDEIGSWSERQLECSYMCMHWVAGSSSADDVLKHRPYLDTLPSPDQLRTPLHFTSVELEAFQGSNLFGATLDRRREGEAEWEECKAVISGVNAEWGSDFTWDRYLTASTYLSSRAFPSTLLSPTPTLVTTPTSHPVLLPGIDALNHARAHPVSWIVSSNAPNEQTVSLVCHAPTPCGAELFNNYGPKPNAELILGYGFSLPHNPDDTIVLKLGGGAPSTSSSTSTAGSLGKWEVGRDARGAGPVWTAVLAAFAAQNDDPTDEGPEDEGAAIEDELCAADTLAHMAQSLHDRLPPFPPPRECMAEMRADVLLMLEHYLEGQRDILQSLVAFAQAKQADALQHAEALGLDIAAEDEEEDEDEA